MTTDATSGRSAGPAPDTAAIDLLLTAQILVAWAGERGESPRLGWWRSDLVSEFGGEDLLRRLAPQTWRWAVLQAVREAARRHDADLRGKDANPDRLISLFRLGFELDERVDERLQELKRSATPPHDALPGLRDLLTAPWNRDAFAAWVAGHGTANIVTAPVGRRIRSAPPAPLDALVAQLVAALAPLGDDYPLPHFKVTA